MSDTSPGARHTGPDTGRDPSANTGPGTGPDTRTGAGTTTGKRTGKGTGTVGITSVHTIGVPVRDQERALDFWVNTLGFDKRLDTPIGGFGRWIEVAPPGCPVSVALVTAHEGLPSGVETGVHFTARDVNATHAAMTARGVDVDEVLRWEGVPPMFTFRDADGNGFEITG